MRRNPDSRPWTSVFGLLFVLVFVSSFHPDAWAGEVSKDSKVPDAAQESAKQPDPAEAVLQSGNDLFVAGDSMAAEKKWLEIRNGEHSSSAWPKAVFNLGVLEREKANYPAAISYFNEVLQSHPHDKEPGRDIMQAYRNYSNRSAVQISVCYEKMGKYRQALRYTWLAKTRYPYLSWCGTCLQSANFALNRRIAYLSFRAYGIPALAMIAFGGILLIWKKSTVL
jgi:tetratricopeptide (TPR) repeat protein